MSIVFVQTQGAQVARDGGRIVVKKHDDVLLDLPVIHLESLHLFGGIGLTTPAAGLLLGSGVDVGFYRRDGGLKGRLVGPRSGNVMLRLAQARLHDVPTWRCDRARSLVCEKIDACGLLLHKFERKKGVVDAGRPRRRFSELRQAAQEATRLESLLGIEGMAARTWFGLFPRFIPERFVWSGRRRRPPKDPVNALLSLAYGLLARRLESGLDASGLDPGLGNLHGIRHGQPSLALDLLEPFRPLVADRFVIRALNLGMFNESHFTSTADGGIHLDPRGRKRFFERWEEFLEKEQWTPRMLTAISQYRRLVLADPRDAHPRRLVLGDDSRVDKGSPPRVCVEADELEPCTTY